MSKNKVLFEIKGLGSIELVDMSSTMEMTVESIETKKIDDLIDINAYGAQSACSACSASGSGSCC